MYGYLLKETIIWDHFCRIFAEFFGLVRRRSSSQLETCAHLQRPADARSRASPVPRGGDGS